MSIAPTSKAALEEAARASTCLASIYEVVAEGGFFHCTSIRALRCILRDGYLRPALETGAPARGAGVASLCRKLGGICLFDVLPVAMGGKTERRNPGRAWLGSWLRIARPVTVAIHLDRERLITQYGAPLSCREARLLGSGVMLPGEVCHRGTISLSSCALGYLFIRSLGRTALTGQYVPQAVLVANEVRNAMACLREKRQNAAGDDTEETDDK